MNPDELAKRLFETAVRNLRADKRMENLQNEGIRLPESVVDAIREDRESH